MVRFMFSKKSGSYVENYEVGKVEAERTVRVKNDHKFFAALPIQRWSLFLIT